MLHLIYDQNNLFITKYKKTTTEHQICPMNEKVFIYNFRSLIHVIIIHFWGMLPLSNIKEGEEEIKKI